MLFIPIGIIMAVTNQHSSIYLICQLVAGAIFPGRPVANMVFVTYGYISSAQGIKFAADLKLGHYMKIPPRILFGVQIVATIVSSLTQIAVLNWMFVHIPGLCTPQAINGFTCPIVSSTTLTLNFFRTTVVMIFCHIPFYPTLSKPN